MDTKTLIEIFGYIGSALVVVSMLMSSIVKLRIINTVGSVISGIYAVICGAIPLALMNACLIAINGYNLVKLLRTHNVYDFVCCGDDDALVKYFLGRYGEDIKQYFPGYTEGTENGKSIFVACCEGNPAGMLIGREHDGILDIDIDYSTPTYRDCTVGKFFYSELPSHDIGKLAFTSELTDAHVSYLKKVGFEQENGVYVKKLA